MRLTHAQVDAYQHQGYLLLPGLLPRVAVDRLNAEVPALFARDSPARVREVDGVTVRSVYGCHLDHELFGSLSHHPAMLEPARQLIGGEVYVYQFKINAKSARRGDLWAWHQDLIYWLKEDGLPGPRIISVALFLDDVIETNAPLHVIPGSHRAGVIDAVPRELNRASPYRDSPPWIADLIAAIKYSVDDTTVAQLSAHQGIDALRGPKGTVLILDPNLVHASPPNDSPHDRKLLFISYNSTENIPVATGEQRPAFLVGRDYRALAPRADRRFEQ